MGWVESLSEALARTIEQSAVLAPVAAFVGGALTALNPCVLAMIPLMVGLAAGVAGRTAETVPGARVWRRTLGFSLLFVAGFALELAVLFSVFAAAASVLEAEWWKYVLVAICGIVGLHLLGVLPIPSIGLRPATGRVAGGVGAVLLGFLFGLISLPCTGPVLLLLIGLVPQIGPARAGLLLFLYGLGHSLLIVIAGTSVGAAASMIQSRRIQNGARALRQAAGTLILGGGVWMLLR
jgi:cytochrome c biogenesis protein CcdA